MTVVCRSAVTGPDSSQVLRYYNARGLMSLYRSPNFCHILIFLNKTMTKGCYMLNINAFRLVIHEKNMFKGVCCINLYKNLSP